MNLISALTSQLGIESTQAEAVAGAVLGTVRAEAPDQAATKLQEAIPELGGWEATAKEALGAAAPATGLLGALTGSGGADVSGPIALLGKLGLSPAHAAMAAPLLMTFLEDRVGAGPMAALIQAVPMLSGLKAVSAPDAGGGAMGAVTGALGGMFGGR